MFTDEPVDERLVNLGPAGFPNTDRLGRALLEPRDDVPAKPLIVIFPEAGVGKEAFMSDGHDAARPELAGHGDNRRPTALVSHGAVGILVTEDDGREPNRGQHRPGDALASADLPQAADQRLQRKGVREFKCPRSTGFSPRRTTKTA